MVLQSVSRMWIYKYIYIHIWYIYIIYQSANHCYNGDREDIIHDGNNKNVAININSTIINIIIIILLSLLWLLW